MFTSFCTWMRYRRLLREKLAIVEDCGYRMSAEAYATAKAEARREASQAP